MKLLNADIFYDYIRILKPATIRYLKNISLLIALICIISAVIVIVQPKAKKVTIKPQSSGASYDKKSQIDQEKKNAILRRFISYNQVKTVY